MERYKIKQDNYNVKVDYSIKHQENNYGSNSYINQSVVDYKSQESVAIKKPSKCPMGAGFGEIGSGCGMRCTRKCAEAA
jgi:pantoate kinase